MPIQHTHPALLQEHSPLYPEFQTILADPPWRFSLRSGKTSPEHRRLYRYDTMSLREIQTLPVPDFAATPCHLYLWVPNALLPQGLDTLTAWGFTFKTQLICYKIRRDGGADTSGCGFYFRNVTESILFGVKGRLLTRKAGRHTANLLATRKREHSRKPEELYDLIEQCSPGPYLELFARYPRPGWTQWPAIPSPES